MQYFSAVFLSFARVVDKYCKKYLFLGATVIPLILLSYFSYYYASVCKENVCVGVSHLYTSRASKFSRFNTLSSLQSQAGNNSVSPY